MGIDQNKEGLLKMVEDSSRLERIKNLSNIKLRYYTTWRLFQENFQVLSDTK